MIALPSALALVAALALGFFPTWVIRLEQARPRLRYSIATVLGALAVVVWFVSAGQLSANDAEMAQLRTAQASDYQKLNQQLSLFESHTATVPKLAIRFSNEQFAIVPTQNGGWIIGINLTFTNDGDDATLRDYYVTAVVPTPNDVGVEQIIRTMHNRVREIPDKGKEVQKLAHGESRVTSATYFVRDHYIIDGISAGLQTLFFDIFFKITTKSGLHCTREYCGYYQGMMIVECPG